MVRQGLALPAGTDVLGRHKVVAVRGDVVVQIGDDLLWVCGTKSEWVVSYIG